MQHCAHLSHVVCQTQVVQATPNPKLLLKLLGTTSLYRATSQDLAFGSCFSRAPFHIHSSTCCSLIRVSLLFLHHLEKHLITHRSNSSVHLSSVLSTEASIDLPITKQKRIELLPPLAWREQQLFQGVYTQTIPVVSLGLTQLCQFRNQDGRKPQKYRDK